MYPLCEQPDKLTPILVDHFGLKLEATDFVVDHNKFNITDSTVDAHECTNPEKAKVIHIVECYFYRRRLGLIKYMCILHWCHFYNHYAQSNQLKYIGYTYGGSLYPIQNFNCTHYTCTFISVLFLKITLSKFNSLFIPYWCQSC